MPARAREDDGEGTEPLDAMGEAWLALTHANDALVASGDVRSVELTRTAMRIVKKRAQAFVRACEAALERIAE